jgi:hypothetical protein
MGGLPTAKPRNAQRALVIYHPWLLEVHFRGAWQKLQEMEARLGTKRTERTTGGPRGGETRLTAKGLGLCAPVSRVDRRAAGPDRAAVCRGVRGVRIFLSIVMLNRPSV